MYLSTSSPFRELTNGPSGVQKVVRYAPLSHPFALVVIGSCLDLRRPQHALQDAHGTEIRSQVSRALLGHSITSRTAVEPFHYPSRIHAWHEHHEQDVRNYCMRLRLR